MDNYTKEEVIMLINENLLTPDVLENILKSTTRKLEIQEDKNALEILKYLSTHKIVPKESKEDIKKFLAEYNSHNLEEIKNEENKKILHSNKILIIYMTIIILLLLIVFFY